MNSGYSVTLVALIVTLGGIWPKGLVPTLAQGVEQENDRRIHEAEQLLQQGSKQFWDSQFEAAIESFQQALKLYQEMTDRRGEGRALGGLGTAYDSLGNYKKAIKFHEQQLAIARETKDRMGESTALGNLGIAWFALGNYGKAVEFYEQSLAIAQEINDRVGLEVNLVNLGNAYQKLGNYAKAIDSYEQLLKISQKLQYRKGERYALNSLGGAYQDLGDCTKALEFRKQSLAIAHEIKDQEWEASALHYLGYTYRDMSHYTEAIAFYEQSLAIAKRIKNLRIEASVLISLGNTYQILKNHAKAIEFYKQHLSLIREVKAKEGETTAFVNLGNAYLALGDNAKAIHLYEQSLAIAREIGHRDREIISLVNLAKVFAEEEAELAIVFYKQAVKVIESIRQDNRKLDRNLQESYTETIAATYRRLADALLSQGRIGEAQQVLELLKIQEINDITEGTRSTTPLAQVALNQVEQKIIQKHDSLIQFGQQLYNCEQQRCSHLSEYQTQYTTLTQAYDQFIAALKADLKAARLQEVESGTQTFLTNGDRLVSAQPRTALIYPLVLEDKVRILWLTQGGALNQTECPIGEAELSKHVEQFRSALQNLHSENSVKQLGKQLYDCLLPTKLQTALRDGGIDNLIFVPDRITNYIPMAALHDGQRYLIETYSVSNILAASFTDTSDRLPSQPQILGFGLSQAVTLSNPTRQFGALAFVPQELDAIVKRNEPSDQQGIFPGQELLNQDFTKDRLATALLDKPNILHIATHGEFVPTDPRTSYFVLGDGTPYPISEVQYLRNLGNLHLVVLSACETALGGRDRNGLEIAGISAYFLGDASKAKAVLASLWKVNDPATSRFMTDFYAMLNRNSLSKTKTLRQVQLDFIRGNLTLTELDQRATIQVVSDPLALGQADRSHPPQSLSHPYYWAPFILIGNSL